VITILFCISKTIVKIPPSKDAKEWVFQTSVVAYFTWIDDTTTTSPPWWWQNNNPSSPSTDYYPFDGFTFSGATTNRANFQNVLLMLILISVVYLVAFFNAY